MIDGLKLTMTGVQLRAKLDERIRWHQDAIRRCPQDETGASERQIETLTLIREYTLADEVYRLGEFDLRFADLLPEDDPWDCGCVPRDGMFSALPDGTPEAH